MTQLSKVRGVLPGKTTDPFTRKQAASASPNCCFSVVTDDRTLDLQAKDKTSREVSTLL